MPEFRRRVVGAYKGIDRDSCALDLKVILETLAHYILRAGILEIVLGRIDRQEVAD